MITKDPNQKWFLDAVNSIFGQTHRDLEIVNIDASSKRPPAITDRRFIYMRQKSVGLWSAFEEGLDKCTGDIIGVLNSDDFLWDNNVIKNILESFDNTDAYIFGNSLRVNVEGKLLYKFVPLRNVNHAIHRFFGFTISHHSFYFRREILQCVKFINKRYDDHYDVNFILNTIKSHDGKYIDLDIAGFRIHAENASRGSYYSMAKFYSVYNGVPQGLYLIPKLFWIFIRPNYAKFILTRSVLNTINYLKQGAHHGTR